MPSLLEEELEYVMVQVARRKEPIKSTHREIGNVIQNFAIRVSINNRDPIPDSVAVRFVSSKLRICIVALVDDARILQLHVCRRLKVNVANECF